MATLAAEDDVDILLTGDGADELLTVPRYTNSRSGVAMIRLDLKLSECSATPAFDGGIVDGVNHPLLSARALDEASSGLA